MNVTKEDIESLKNEWLHALNYKHDQIDHKKMLKIVKEMAKAPWDDPFYGKTWIYDPITRKLI